MFSDHRRIKLEINQKKKEEIPQMLGNLAIYFKNRSKEKISLEIGKYL